MPLTAPTKFTWKLQPIVTQNQNPPVRNQWYTLVDLKGGVQLDMMTIYQTNDELANKDLEVEVTIDDQTPTTWASDPANNTPYFLYFLPDQQTVNMQTTTELLPLVSNDVTASLPYQCSKLLIRYRQTAVLGTNQIVAAQAVHKLFR